MDLFPFLMKRLLMNLLQEQFALCIALCIPTVHHFTRKMHGHLQRPPKSGFLLQKGKFSLIGAHMTNQPYNWVG